MFSPFQFPWKFRVSTPIVLNTIAGLLMGGSAIALVATFIQITAARAVISLGGSANTGPSGAVPAVLTVVLQLLAWPCLYLAHIMVWNFRLREAICWAFGKSVQAKAQWKLTESKEKAKHVFFTYNISKNLVIKVLRDGSQELWNTSGGEFSASLGQALGETGFIGKVFGEGGVIHDTISDGAVTNNLSRPNPVSEYGDDNV